MRPTAAAARRLPASQDDVRRHDLGRLLALLRVRGATSRADLTALTGRNRSTVEALTAELVEAGLAVESAPVGRGGAGRPSITVQPASDHVHVLSVDLGVERLTAARVGLGGVVLDRRSLRQTPGDSSVPSALARLSGPLQALLESAVREALAGALAAPGEGVRLAVAGLADDSVLVGAAEPAFAPLLEDPLGLLQLHLHGSAPVGAGA